MKISKILAVLLCIAVVFALVPSGFALPRIIDSNRQVSLSLTYASETEPVSGATFDLFLVATRDAEGGWVLENGFADYPIDIDTGDESVMNALASTLVGYVLKDDITPLESAVTNDRGRVRFPGGAALEHGLYLLMGRQHRQNGRIYTAQPVTLLLPMLSYDHMEWVYDVEMSIKCESKEDPGVPQYLIRKVLKVWNDEGHEEFRPQEVIVELLRDGESYDTVTLTEDGSWRYKWEELPAESTWHLIEQPLEDYTVEIHQEGITFVVVNTYNESEPPPETPVPPGETTPPPGETTPPPGETTPPPGETTPPPGETTPPPGETTPPPGETTLPPGETTPPPGETTPPPGETTPPPGETTPPPGETTPPPGETTPPPDETTPPPGETTPPPDETTPPPGETTPPPGETTPPPGETTPPPGETTPPPGETTPPPVTPTPPPATPTPTPVPTLPQTGQIWWPSTAMLSIGLLLVVLGLIRRRTSSGDKPQGGILMTLGAVALLGAGMYAGYNMFEARKAGESAERSLMELQNMIPDQVSSEMVYAPYVLPTAAPVVPAVPIENDEPEKRVTATVRPVTTPVIEHIAELEIPDYVLNPKMPMPVLESNGQKYIGVLRIPVLDLELPVISDWTYKRFKVAPCRYYGSAYQDNLVIAAHNYERHFGRLADLREGDYVSFTDADGNRFAYQVVWKETLNPRDVKDMISGEFDLTLFTCTVGGSHRVTIRCDRIG